MTSFLVAPAADAAGSITSLKTVVGDQATAGVGETITYQIDLACSSLTDNCGEAVFTDLLPPGLDLVGVDLTGAPAWVTSDDGAGLITVARDPGGDPIFQDGESAQFFITVRVNGAADPDVDIVNTANITSTGGTPDSPSEAPGIDVLPAAPKWETSKRQTAPPGGVDPAPNVPVTYRLEFCGSTIGNLGLEDIVLVDQLPTAGDGSFPVVNDADGGIYDPIANTISWTLDPVTQLELFDAAVVGDSELCQRFDISLTYPAIEADPSGFVIGTDITNTAVATDGPLDGDGTGICGPNCSDGVAAEIAAGSAVLGVSKSGDSEVSPNGILTYALAIDTLDANIAAIDAALIDDTPDELQIRGFDLTDNSVYGVEVWITAEGGAAPVLLADIVPFSPGPMQSQNEFAYRQTEFDVALGAGAVVDKVEFQFYDLLSGAKVKRLQPTQTLAVTVFTELTATAGGVGTVFSNCALAASSDGTVETDPCHPSTITEGDADYRVDKILLPPSISPGDTQTVVLRMWANSTNAVPIFDPMLFDLLPAEFEYLGDATVTVASSAGINVLPLPTLEAGETSFAVEEDFGEPGRTLVRFNWPGYALNWTAAEQNAAEDYVDKFIEVRFDVLLEDATPAGPYKDLAGGTTTSSAGAVCPDLGDVTDYDDTSGALTAIACFDTAIATVLPAAQLKGAKWDAAELGIPNYNAIDDEWDDPTCPVFGTDYTRFPCTAQTVPGQNVNYLIDIQNSGNVDLQDYWMYDILPHVGDTGVGEALFTASRGTEFEVSITGPITIANLPAGAGTPVIEYSESTNPCRDEVANPGTATPWPSGCVDDWTDTPVSFAAVRAFRVNVPFAVDKFDGGESFQIEVPGFVPAGAPWDAIAWNSYAHTAANAEAAGNPTLLPSEPRQVGIRVPGLDEPEFDPQIYPIPYDLALQKSLDIAASPDVFDGVGAGDEVTFNIRIENQGQVVDSLSVVDYIDLTKFAPFDAGIQTTSVIDLRLRDGSEPGDPWTITWSGGGTGLATASLTPVSGDLFIGDVIEFPIVLVVADDDVRTDGAIENWAEISDFDNSADADAEVDEDSTPDTDQTNDNQPTAAGEPGDDIVTGDGDQTGPIDPERNDEDDHDVAGLPFWDLSLVKERGAGQNFVINTSTTPPTATWAVTVKNQGPEDAFLVMVADQLPAGMSFLSLGSTTAGDASVTTSASAGATGQIMFSIDELLASTGEPLATGEFVTFEFTTRLDDPTLVEYVNIAEISGFDDDAIASNPPNPLAVDTDSTPDLDPFDDVVLDDLGTDPSGEDDRNSHNEIDYDPDGDLNVNEPTTNLAGDVIDEDDHDQEVVFLPWDLALEKRLATQPAGPLEQGVSTVDFLIEVTGQGRPVQMIEITDYIDITLWSPLTILPADGVVNDVGGDGDAFNYTWSNAGAAPVVTVTGQSATDELGYGESILIPVSLTIAATWDGTQLVNWAEISDFDDDLDPSVTANSDLLDDLFDADSTPNGVLEDDNQPTGPGADGDGVITGDGVGSDPIANDEDDHDIAGVPIWDLELIKQLGVGQPFVVDLSTSPPIATWSITVTNQGTEDVFAVTVDDLLPPGLAFGAIGTVTPGVTPSSVSTSAGTGAIGTIQFVIDALQAGDSVTWEFSTDVFNLGLTEFVNIAEISSFDDDSDPTNPPNLAARDIDSTPDAIPGNDLILDIPGTDPSGEDDRNSHNDDNYDPDLDGNVNEPTTNLAGDIVDEDDHDQEVLTMPFDLALQKQLSRAPATPLIPGTSTVTFDLVVTNQGRSIQSIDVVDYIDTTLFESFVPVLNPDADGITTALVADSGDGDLFSYGWDVTDLDNPVVSITADSATGVLFFGESITIPITLRVDADWDASPLVNWAEISRFDNDTEPTNGDSDPTNPANILDGPFEDIDSVPDTEQTLDNQPTGPGADGDDIITGDGVTADPILGDEDDHDVAGIPIWDLELIKELGTGQGFLMDLSTTPPTATWSVTVNNQGDQDAFLIEVTDEIPAGLEFLTLGSVTAGTAGVTTSAAVADTGPIQLEIDALPAGDSVTFDIVTAFNGGGDGEFVNIAEISSFDNDDTVGNPANPLAVDIDSTPDTIPDNDAILDIPGTDPNGNDDRNSNNLDNFDEDSDGNVNEVNPSDEDDHDQEVIVLPYDLALRKVIAEGPNDPFLPGDTEILFNFEIVNQGRPVQMIEVVDYIDPALWETFDAGLNPDSGVTVLDLVDDGDGDVFRYTWDDTDPVNPVVTLVALDPIAGELAFGETLRMPIRLTIDVAWNGDDLVNWAEISDFDNDTDPTVTANSDPADELVDLDSTPDGVQGDDNQPVAWGELGDNVITGDGVTADPILGDEDDHDVAGVKFWDLALINTLGTGQSYSVNPATGAVTVTWSVTVKNQGNQDAFFVSVANQLPEGMAFDALTPVAGVSTTAGPGATGAIGFSIDELLAGESVTFEFTADIVDATIGEYLNIAEISSFDDNNIPGDPANLAATDIDSVPDLDPTNDAVLDDVGTDPNNNDDLNSHNFIDYDADGDGNVNERELDGGGFVIDEDDHGQEIIVTSFDLALAKVFVSGPTAPLTPGSSTVDFDIVVTNQGRPVRSLNVVDYIDPDLWEAFDTGLNASSGTITDSGGDTYSFVWDDTVPLAPVISLVADSGEFRAGETITIPVTLTIEAGWRDGAPLVNWAEISNFDNDTDPTNGDADPDNLANGGVPFVDVDSTPDVVQLNDNRPDGPGEPGDDVITGDGVDADPILGDEDDHDVAGVPIWDLALINELGLTQPFIVDLSTTPPTVVWTVTVKNQGNQDAFLIDVTDQIPAGMEFDSIGTVTDSLGDITGVTTSATTGATGPIDFQIDTLAPGDSVTFEINMNVIDLTIDEFVDVAEISAFDDDADAGTTNPAAFDVDSTPDSAPGDQILTVDGTDPNGNDDRNSHNLIDYDYDTDFNVNEITPQDEDDHDQEVVVLPFDLALAKAVGVAPVFPLLSGTSEITFDIVVTNQGRPVQTISVVDYVDPLLWDGFNATLNPNGSVADSGGETFDYTWEADSIAPVLTLVGVADAELVFGETVTIPVTLTIDTDWDGDPLVNWSEISNFDNDTDPTNGDADPANLANATDGPFVDLDSTPDVVQGNDNQPTGPGQPGDNVITGDGDPDAVPIDPLLNDEDDHDVAGVEFWDLALINELGAGQSYSVNPATGAVTVTWSITVKNQGNQDAFLIDVTNQLPEGMEFNALTPVTGVSTSAAPGATGALGFSIDELLAGESVTFEFTADMVDTTIGEYLNIAEISSFDDTDTASDPVNPAAIDIDSVPDLDPTNDAVLVDDGTDPNGNDDLNSHNFIDFDADGDGNVNERELDAGGTVIDEDDHGQEIIVTSFDLALAKVFVSGPTAPLTPGSSTVDFDIVVTNQGRPVRSLNVVDYIDSDLWEAFDTGLNASSGTIIDSGGDTFDFVWDDTVPLAPVISLTTADGAFVFDETITIPVTLTIQPLWTGADLVNWAEISNFDNDTNPANGDADPDNPANAGVPFVDVDSTPDVDQFDDNQPTAWGEPGDDVIAGDGDPDADPLDPVLNDEDDHDVAGVPIWDLALINELGPTQPFIIDLSTTPPTVVWTVTVKNQGNQDAFLIDVTDQIPAGMEFDSIGAITGAGVTTGAAAGATGPIDFQIDTLAPGDSVTFEINMNVIDIELDEFVNVAEISAFDDDAVSDNDPNPAAFDVDSTPDTTPDDQILTVDGTDPNGNDDRNSHNQIDYDYDVDTNLNEITPEDEDDHDQEVVVMVFDLALGTTLTAYPTTPITPGETTVGFEIVVTNQGRPVRTVSVVDYIDPVLWEGFDTTLNGDGVVVDSGGDTFSYTWDNTDPEAPVVTLVADSGMLLFDETITIPVTLVIADDWNGDDLVNWAEISNFDNDTDPTNGDADPANPANAADGPFVDLDSTPDVDQGDDNQPTAWGEPGDDVIDGDGVDADPILGDEDDHDVAGVPIWDLALINELGGSQGFVIDVANDPRTVDWSITVKNQGNQDAFLVAVTNQIPAGMEFDSLGATTDGSAVVSTAATAGDSGAIEFTIDALPVGDSLTFNFRTAVVDPTIDTFLNVAEISSFDDNADPDDDPNPDAVDIDSVPNADPSDDESLSADGTDPNGNDDRNSHNDIDYDVDADGNVNEPSVNSDGDVIDEDDHDRELVVLPYDLALTKTLSPTTVFPLFPGAIATFDITIVNQGRLVEDFSVVDYIDTGVWESFNPTLNPTGIVDSFMYSWDMSDPAAPIVRIDGVLATTATVTIPVTLQISPDYSSATTPLENWAEISEFDNDGDPNTPAPDDLDSTPNTDQADDNQPIGSGQPGDDAIDGDGAGSNPILDDEDDHDVAGIPVLDLALYTTLSDVTELPVIRGSEVTFDITIINQGSTHVTNPTITDYVDLEDWEAFDLTLNGPGTTTGDAELPFSWEAAGTDGLVTIEGTIAPGEVVVVTVTLQINQTSTLDELLNVAEISSSIATDSDGTPVLNPDGSVPVDIDSVPNTDSSDDNQPTEPGDSTDNDITNGPGSDGADEDDHDIAGVEAPTYSLGNQVWLDIDDDGVTGAGESGIDGVIVELYADLDGDGTDELIATTTTVSSDLNGDGTIDPLTESGLYLFDGLVRGDYEVVLPAANFARGAALESLTSSTPTSADANDDVDNDDNGVITGDEVRSGPVSIGPGMPAGESPDNDLVTPDGHENLTVDFGFNSFSLGNELWFDLNNDGILDDDEPPVVGAVVELFSDADGDGIADDRNDDGQLTSEDAIASTTTNEQGEFLFDGLRPGDYIVGVPPSQFEADAVLDGYLSSTPTTVDPNDDVSNDDNGDLDEVSGYVLTGVITIGTDEPTGEIDDNDPLTPDTNENLTIDLGFWIPALFPRPTSSGADTPPAVTGGGSVPSSTTTPATVPISTQPLALTGSNVWAMVRFALMLIAIGTGMVLIVRRSRREDELDDGS